MLEFEERTVMEIFIEKFWILKSIERNISNQILLQIITEIECYYNTIEEISRELDQLEM